MTQSVELLLDDTADAGVRSQWAALAAAGLPSQARHTGASNRPHVTLAARRWIDPAVEPALVSAVGGLPLPVRLGSAALFGSGPYVLVRLVVPTRALLDLQAAVRDLLGPDRTTDTHFAPGAWTPHVTLARRLAAQQVPAALDVLAGGRDLDARLVSCRRWDGDARREWRLRPA
jgi:2'-5' RNA ligase